MDIKQRDILASLPLVASVLGKRYGVKVFIGGDSAYTDGNEIHLPTLTEDAVPYARGLLDHESSHCRFTDFSAVQNAGLDHIGRWIQNALEDFMVESRLAERYPGCKDNFRWLIKKLFVEQKADADDEAPAFLLNYILLTLRSWAVSELETRLKRLRKRIDGEFPGLRADIDSLLQQFRSETTLTTHTTIAYAKQFVSLLRKYAQDSSSQQAKAGGDSKDATDNEKSSAPTDGSTGEGGPSDSAQQTLKDMLEDPASELPESISDKLEKKLKAGASKAKNSSSAIEVATVGNAHTHLMSDKDMAAGMRASCRLRAKLAALLETRTRFACRYGYRGELRSHALARVAVNSTKIFSRREEGQGIDTAVHLLLDASGSMAVDPMAITQQAAYAVCKALSVNPKINLAVTAFPGGVGNTVTPLLKHGEHLPRRPSVVSALGTTPLGPALWWVLSQMCLLRQQRKIILVLTDGFPDDSSQVKMALKDCANAHIEVYAIGIMEAGVKLFFDSRHCSVIQNLNELPDALFSILSKTI